MSWELEWESEMTVKDTQIRDGAWLLVRFCSCGVIDG